MFQVLPPTYAPHQSPSPPMDTTLLVPETTSTTITFTDRNGVPKARKMRASCDACSRAKVKCDKARPICNRCTNMNMCCNYSPSMRLGKPRKNRNLEDRPLPRDVSPAGSSATAGSRSDVVPRTAIYTAESSPEPTDSFFFCPATPEYHYQDTLMVNGFGGGQSPDFSETSLVSNWSNEEQVAFGASTDIFPTMPHYLPSNPPYGGHARSGSGQSQMEMFPPAEPFFFPPMGAAQLNTVQNPIPLQQDKTMTSPPPMTCAPLPTPPLPSSNSSSYAETTSHDCTRDAFQTLSHLYTPTQSPFSTTESQKRTMDRIPTWNDILSTTKSSMDRLGALLDCPCSANPHFSTTIACAITKILSWYPSIAGPDDQTNPLTATTRMEPVTRTSNPIQTSSPPDTDNTVNLRTNAILSELRRVEKLINKFSERYAQPTSTSTTTTTHYNADTGIDSCVFAALEAQLRSQVRDTFQVIMRTAPEEVKRQVAMQSQNRARVHTM